MADDEKFLVVPLGKKSKAITQTVSNDTAMEIMELLADGPLSTSKVAEKLGIPLTTAQYNIEKLMEAGLVKIARTKYSEKGREVKLYEAMNRAIIILPGKSGAGAVMDALKRYIILLPVAIAASLAVEYLMPAAPGAHAPLPAGAVTGTVGMGEKFVAGTGAPMANDTLSVASTPMPAVAPMANWQNATYEAGSNVTSSMPMPASMPATNGQHVEVARAVVDQASQAPVPYLQHAGLLFFAGCLLVLLLLVVLEYARYRKASKK